MLTLLLICLFPVLGGTNSIGVELRRDLLDLCRKTRDMGPGNECHGISSSAFQNFLDALRDVIGPTHKDSKEFYNATSATSWEIHCLAQQKLNDIRTPPVCVAAAYAYIPFPVHPIHHILPKNKTNAQIYMEYKLLVVTVDSNYKTCRAPTPRSAYMHNIQLHVLGSGIKNFYSKGLGAKVDLFRSFMSRIPQNDTSTVIMFVDGSDVIFQDGESLILNRFIESHTSILFSAEHACYPMKYFPWNLNLGMWMGPCSGACSNSRYVCDTLFPSPFQHSALADDSTNRWLNSGGFIGYARYRLAIIILRLKKS